MTHWVEKNLASLITVMSVALLLTACSSSEEPTNASDPDLERLKTRVEQRWQARTIRDWEAAWEYTTPNYRAIFPKRLYINKFSYAVDWELTAIEVVNYDALAAVASVAVGVMSSSTKQTYAASSSIGALPYTFNEQWLYVDGDWWFSANE
jgi:hypothetical protein